MFNLIDLENALIPQISLVEIKIADIRIELEPSPIPLLPVIHIDAKLDIRLGF